jgi:hypothetical protein
MNTLTGMSGKKFVIDNEDLLHNSFLGTIPGTVSIKKAVHQ